MRRWTNLLTLALALLALPATAQDIRIDVPVELKKARVVFNLDHAAFEGDQPTGLAFMKILSAYFKAQGTDARLVAIFHGAAGYMLLGDAAYGRVRNWTGGNPYKDQIAALIAAGVEIEECAETMRANRWGNADLLPGVKVNTGANMRLIQLMQDGFVQLQP
jgi:intracellular sulfur oxidation DsrE/DsrF family protein